MAQCQYKPSCFLFQRGALTERDLELEHKQRIRICLCSLNNTGTRVHPECKRELKLSLSESTLT